MFIYSICIYENDDSYDFGSIVSSFLLLVDQNIKSSSTYFSYLNIKDWLSQGKYEYDCSYIVLENSVKPKMVTSLELIFVKSKTYINV